MSPNHKTRAANVATKMRLVRLTPAEDDHWKAAAEAMTGGNVSELVRRCVELEIGKPPEPWTEGEESEA